MKTPKLVLNSLSARPTKLTSWVEDMLSNVVREHGQDLGMKPSQTVRRLIILGLQADGVNIVSDIKPRGKL